MVNYNVSKLDEAEWKQEPFRHAVIDGLWNPDLLHSVLDQWPDKYSTRWRYYNDPDEKGKGQADVNHLDRAANLLFRELHSSAFRNELTTLTQHSDLKPDDLGGGLHQTATGGKLGMHVDFNTHPSLQGWERKLNLLVFLNEEWEYEWGGTLFLGENREVGVVPAFNRTVLFECSSVSWHGHPQPIIGDHVRRSVAVYYYTPTFDGGLEHTTIFNRKN